MRVAYAGVYDPETVGLMGRALDSAWAQFTPHPKDKDLARLFMASAILEKIEDGGESAEDLVETAILALQAALSSPLLQSALRREGGVLRPPTAVHADGKGAAVSMASRRGRQGVMQSAQGRRRFGRGDRWGTTRRR
jgi:hypothetical protein